MLRHAVFLDGQERLEEGISPMPNGNLVMKIKRLVRASVLNRRDMSQVCVKGGISLTESNMFLTSWAGFSIPLSKILLVDNFGQYFGNSCNCRCYIGSWNRQRCGQTISGIMKGGYKSVSAFTGTAFLSSNAAWA
jgi:hypothetical protein